MKVSEYLLINKVLVKKFYEDQAFILFLLIVVSYGFLSGKEHIELAKAFTSSLSLIWMPFTFWTLFAAWVINTFYHQINSTQNAFLREFKKSSYSKRLVIWMMTFHGNFLLISTYAVFMMIVAFQNDFWMVLVVIILYLIFISILAVLIMDRMLIRQFHRKKWTRHKINLPHWTFELQYLVQQKSLMTFLLKLLSLSILYFSIQYYQIEDFDLRFLMAVIILNGAVHYPLISGVQIFIQRYMTYLRNLPISLNSLYLRMSFILFLLYLPDLAIWIYWIPPNIPFSSALGLIFVSFLWLLFIYSICLLNPGNADRQLKNVVYTSIVLFLLILYGIPIFLLITIFGVSGYFLFKKYYPLLFDT